MEKSPSGCAALPAAPPSPIRILVIDDDPLVAQALRYTLERDGHYVTTANGGEAGVDTFRAARNQGAGFDLVLTDLGMPYVDGRRVASAVKSRIPLHASRSVDLAGDGGSLPKETRASQRRSSAQQTARSGCAARCSWPVAAQSGSEQSKTRAIVQRQMLY